MCVTSVKSKFTNEKFLAKQGNYLNKKIAN